LTFEPAEIIERAAPEAGVMQLPNVAALTDVDHVRRRAFQMADERGKQRGQERETPAPEKSSTKRRLGRPPKPKEELKSRNLTFRAREKLRDSLQQAAHENGRSISEEIEYRLESTFKEQEVIIRALGGPDAEYLVRPILFFLGLLRTRQIKWKDDPDAAGAMRQAIGLIAEAVFCPSAPPRNLEREFLHAFREYCTAGAILSCAILTLHAFGFGLVERLGSADSQSSNGDPKP
jgi:hypothetical protein